MKRDEFLRSLSVSLLAAPALSATLSSCKSAYYAPAHLTVEGNQLVLSRKSFFFLRNEVERTRSFVLIKMSSSDIPICVYRINEGNYVASLMRCTHRSCELNVGGGIFTCPCHGSEFSITGQVLEGPAEQNLTTYPITTDNENIYIHLA